MNKFLFLGALFALILSITACTDESEQSIHQGEHALGTQISSDPSIQIDENLEQVIQMIDESTTIDVGDASTRSSTVYYHPSPRNGQCGKSSYLFYLKDNGNDPQRAVRLQMPNGSTLYFNLYRWTDYQYISLKSYTCGDIFWTMVDANTKQPLIGEYKVKNTGVSIAPGATSKLGWIFKSDGSSWQEKNGWHIVHGSMFHTGIDKYAQDWNKGPNVDSDEGAKMTAPLCGQVVSAGWLNNCYGNAVDIVHYAGKKKVMHRITHMKNVSVSLGQWIERGQLIGTLGKSGSATCPDSDGWPPHAHCVLYSLTADESISSGIKFNYSY